MGPGPLARHRGHRASATEPRHVARLEHRRGLLPDPAALAILLSAIASGKLILGLLTVLVFSLGFASVLVVVGVVAAQVGQLILTWLSNRWMSWIQIGAALLIVGVGLVLTTTALRTVTALR